MATYSFDTITSAQALAFHPASDTLSLSVGVKGLSVVFDDSVGRIAVTALDTGRTVVFGSAVYGASIGGAGVLKLGTPDADYVPALSSARAVYTGAGDDVINAVFQQVVGAGAGRDVLVLTQTNGFIRMVDWEPGVDRLYFASQAVTAGNYVEGSAATATDEQAYIKQQFAAGKNYVAVARDGNVTVYYHQDGVQDFTYGVVTLVGRTLEQISPADILTGAQPGDPATPPPPTLPTSTGRVEGNMDLQHLSSLVGGDVAEATATRLTVHAADASIILTGTGLTYDANSQIKGGVVSSVTYATGQFPAANVFRFDVSGLAVSAAEFTRWLLTDATQEAFATALAGANMIYGSNGGDLIRGYGGDDLIAGSGASVARPDSIFGGLGDDAIYAGRFPNDATPGLFVGSTYLRGDEGNDQITGGGGFDDINGNIGSDTAHGGAGEDWVVGGKDSDLLFGDAGYDIVYGNLGSDTCSGGDGDDIVRGGQDNDIVLGGAGDDYVSGDRGEDTVTGGAGADLFHTFGEAGIDRVTDFSLAQGDRVLLDPGTQYAVTQVGADTVISMTGGGQMILVGVQLASLTPGWIFGA